MAEFHEILKLLSDESRYKIINTLLEKDLCVGGLASKIGISKPAVSQHLQLLRKAQLVKGEKRGYYTHYSVNRNMLVELGNTFLEMSKKEKNSDSCNRSYHDDCMCSCDEEK